MTAASVATFLGHCADAHEQTAMRCHMLTLRPEERWHEEPRVEYHTGMAGELHGVVRQLRAYDRQTAAERSASN